jgi:hypothetical protein
LIIGHDTSVCPKALKDGPDLLDPDIRVSTHCQSDAISKLIVFLNPSKVGDTIPLVKVCPHCCRCCPKEGPMAIMDLTWRSISSQSAIATNLA